MTKRVISMFSLLMINIIAVDSLRTLPVAAAYGWSLITYYAIAALAFFIPSALATAELASGWPSRGGIYVWVREAFGPRWGFFIVFMQWFYNIVWYPTILSFIAATVAFLFRPEWVTNQCFMAISAILLYWVATLANMYGMRLSSWVSTLGALVGTLLPMAGIVGLVLMWISKGNAPATPWSLSALIPDGSSLNQLVFFSAILYGLIGLEMSGAHAEEVKDPERNYPKAMWWSIGLILVSLVTASLAIQAVIPKDHLNILTGLIAAYDVFLTSLGLRAWLPLVVFLMAFGALACMAAWIIGPAKGILVAVKDGFLPPSWQVENKHHVPSRLLGWQGVLCTVLCGVFVLLPSVASAYWLLTAIAAQLSLVVYIGLFAALWKLRQKEPDRPRFFKIPGGRVGLVLVCGLGITTSAVTILLGFLPPAQIPVGNIWYYETLLILANGIACAAPFCFERIKKKRRAAS